MALINYWLYRILNLTLMSYAALYQRYMMVIGLQWGLDIFLLRVICFGWIGKSILIWIMLKDGSYLSYGYFTHFFICTFASGYAVFLLFGSKIGWNHLKELFVLNRVNLHLVRLPRIDAICTIYQELLHCLSYSLCKYYHFDTGSIMLSLKILEFLM